MKKKKEYDAIHIIHFIVYRNIDLRLYRPAIASEMLRNILDLPLLFLNLTTVCMG